MWRICNEDAHARVYPLYCFLLSARTSNRLLRSYLSKREIHNARKQTVILITASKVMDVPLELMYL